MAKKEVTTDLWVNDLLKEANIKLDPQGSHIKEINDALKTGRTVYFNGKAIKNLNLTNTYPKVSVLIGWELIAFMEKNQRAFGTWMLEI